MASNVISDHVVKLSMSSLKIGSFSPGESIRDVEAGAGPPSASGSVAGAGPPSAEASERAGSRPFMPMTGERAADLRLQMDWRHHHLKAF